MDPAHSTERSIPARARVLIALILSVALGAAASADETVLNWMGGPGTAAIGDLAEIDLPEDFVYLDGEGTETLMQLLENPLTGLELATVAPASDEESWFLVFEFEDIGWVDDSERDDLDADELLESIRAGTAEANEERRERGWAEFEVVGWREAPHYDERTNNLTWAIEGRAGEHTSINRIVKLLGRRGVMTVTLVSTPDELQMASVASDRLLGGYRFQPGSTYAEYVPGTDKIASYGLAALIAGGVGAAALKSGLLVRIWKFLLFGAVAVGGAIKRIFTGRQHIEDPPTAA